MKSNVLKLFLIAIIVAASSNISYAQPSYANNETKTIVTKMIDAHGGYETWSNAPSISFHHVLKGPGIEWVTDEIHQQGSRKSYLEWGDGAKLGFDGNDVWSVDWKIQNPPGMMAGVAYFFLNMPWITQDNGVQLELIEDEEVSYIEEGKSYYTVHMTYNGASPYEYYDLYIDKDSFLLKGMEYTMVDKDLMKVFNMPPDTKFMGPLLKVYREFTEIDGLTFPVDYVTHALPQGGVIMGTHIASDISFRKKFDESKAARPNNGVIFKSLNNKN